VLQHCAELVEHSVRLVEDVTTKGFIRSRKSSADTASRKARTAVFGYGIYMDLLRISGMWLTVMSFFQTSEEHGVRKIFPEGLNEGIVAENTFSHTCKGLNKG
jgi:gamma-glutamylcysteine synthetase